MPDTTDRHPRGLSREIHHPADSGDTGAGRQSHHAVPAEKEMGLPKATRALTGVG